MNIWAILGIPRDSDRSAIRRAYATRLRETNPEDDPEGFKRLRAAYDAALRHLDYAAAWESFDDEEEAAGIGDSDWNPPPPDTTPNDPSGQAPAEEPEIAAALAAREAELEALRAAMSDLEAGLRGPWRASDAVLEARLNAILRTPALGEIRIRTDIEPWLAGLLASTIPHSDAVLLQSIQAFGWADGDRRRIDPGVAMVLDRLDEWRLIESLNRPSHVHHAAWRSLTRPPGAWWSWRINAFRPGMIAGVEIFLGIRGEVARGLHYSFRKESVERWRRFLAKPRMTLGILALMPLVFLGLLWLAVIVAGSGAVTSTALIAGASGLAFATPLGALFLLARWRQRFRERTMRRRWLADGWLGAYAALTFATMALPPPYWPTFIVLPAIGIAIWSYIVAPPAEPGSLQLGGGAALCAGAVGVLLISSPHFEPVEAFALAVTACLLIYLRLALWSAVSVTLGRLLGRRREWFILGGTAAGLAIAFAAFQLRSTWHPVAPIYPVALAAMALLPLVGAPQRGTEGPPRAIALVTLMLGFLAALGASMPPDPAVDPTAPPVAMALSEDARADLAMAALEKRQPAFARLRKSNPALYLDIRAVMKRFALARIGRSEADREIGALIDQAYAARLSGASAPLLIEGLRIRLAHLQALRGTAPSACAAGGSGEDGPVKSDDLRKRKTAEIFGVISNPPEPRPVGRSIPGAELAARAAVAEHVDPSTLLSRLQGREGVGAACAARIAVTQALLDSEPVADVAATLRAQYRRRSAAKPKPSIDEHAANRRV